MYWFEMGRRGKRDANQREDWSSDGDVEKPEIGRRKGKRRERENDEREKVEKDRKFTMGKGKEKKGGIKKKEKYL